MTYREIWEKGGFFLMEDRVKTQREVIYEEVFNAMQHAEEMGGPEGPEYVKLMTDIAAECIRRVSNFSEWNKPEKPQVLTLEQFQNSGRNVRLKDVSDLQIESECEFGRIYDGYHYIELMDSGEWYLIIERSEYVDSNLANLEKRLYEDWYVPNFGR